MSGPSRSTAVPASNAEFRSFQIERAGRDALRDVNCKCQGTGVVRTRRQGQRILRQCEPCWTARARALSEWRDEHPWEARAMREARGVRRRARWEAERKAERPRDKHGESPF